MPLLILLLLLIPNVILAQSGSSVDAGTTFYNFGGISGTRQSSGKTDFYNFQGIVKPAGIIANRNLKLTDEAVLCVQAIRDQYTKEITP